MTPKQILDGFSESLMQDERILSGQERALLANLLQHTKTTSNSDPAIQSAVSQVIAAAVGETVAQRAFTVLGTSIIERILNGLTVANVADDVTHYAGPKPPSPGPQPPGAAPLPSGPQPPGVRKVPTTPPGPQPPGAPQPAPTDLPSGPQPPGHGLQPSDVQMSGRERQSGEREMVGVLDSPNVISRQCVVLDEFLAPQELDELVAFTLQRETEFQTSEVISPAGGVIDYSHRRSRVLLDVGPHEDVILERIKRVLPIVLRQLNLKEYPIVRTETQVTASNDADSFGPHTDNGQEEVASRYLTFVYFFHREPKQFEGGELRIHERQQGKRPLSEAPYQTVVPQQNQIVFFPCSVMHEITPVECASRAFADSRFTLNGWIHK
jgi:SM-20-related protein